jgi:hypothetical protein
VRTCSTYNFKGALRAPGRGWPPFMRKRRTTAALTVERRCVPPVAGWSPGDRGAPGAGCLPLAPSGHVGADAHSALAADRTGSAPQRQQWRAGLQARPFLRRPILKPCKIAGKGAPAARRLLAQVQTLARES